MTSRSKWVTPVFGLCLAAVMGLVELKRSGSTLSAGLAAAVVAGYAIALLILRSRSETVGALSGLPVDERWISINQRALAFAAQIVAVFLVAAFLITEFAGGAALPYAWSAVALTAAYLGGVLWYRWRS